MAINQTKYETHMQVRPDDIDMNRHVHNSRYLDYVLAARYDQMARCYGMPMEEYLEHGYSWVVRAVSAEYLRPLGLGDHVVVRTWIDGFEGRGVRVGFEILKQANDPAAAPKLACGGHFDYTMIDTTTGRSVAIPDWVIARYSIPDSKE